MATGAAAAQRRSHRDRSRTPPSPPWSRSCSGRPRPPGCAAPPAVALRTGSTSSCPLRWPPTRILRVETDTTGVVSTLRMRLGDVLEQCYILQLKCEALRQNRRQQAVDGVVEQGVGVGRPAELLPEFVVDAVVDQALPQLLGGAAPRLAVGEV